MGSAVKSVDFTVSCPLLPSYLSSAALDPSTIFAIRAEDRQARRRYAAGRQRRPQPHLPRMGHDHLYGGMWLFAQTGTQMKSHPLAIPVIGFDWHNSRKTGVCVSKPGPLCGRLCALGPNLASNRDRTDGRQPCVT